MDTTLADLLAAAIRQRNSPLAGRTRMGNIPGAIPEEWPPPPPEGWPPPPGGLPPAQPENPNAVQDERLDRWVDRTVYDKPQIAGELNTLQPQELEQWKLNDLRQLDEMEKRFRFSPLRTSR